MTITSYSPSFSKWIHCHNKPLIKCTRKFIFIYNKAKENNENIHTKRHLSPSLAIRYRFKCVNTLTRCACRHTKSLVLFSPSPVFVPFIWMTNGIENVLRELRANYSSTHRMKTKTRSHRIQKLYFDFRYVLHSLIFSLSQFFFQLFTVPYGIPTSNCTVLWFFFVILFCPFS